MMISNIPWFSGKPLKHLKTLGFMCFEIGVKQGRIPSLCLVVFSVGDVLECFWEIMGNLSTFQFGSVKKWLGKSKFWIQFLGENDVAMNKFWNLKAWRK
jgi:hypothetical protein